ncbi:hypothetical protein PHISCL_05772 [Aspergillus sclerotialis]|uniref:Uncharacterized protein n=1 Tax=Aspergillus sclerotialis TaxID=2070753 RepID=A0A3A2ZKG5_9EURO|nr:hypothetical protein PHISCL_05772 [Aspergillus sclerotialis]
MGIESGVHPRYTQERVFEQGHWRWKKVRDGVSRHVGKTFNGADPKSFYTTVILEIRLKGGVTAWYSDDSNHPLNASGPSRSWYYKSKRGGSWVDTEGKNRVIFVAMPVSSNNPKSALCVGGEGTLRGIYIPVSCPASPQYPDKNAYAGVNLTWYTGTISKYRYEANKFTKTGDYHTSHQREDGYQLKDTVFVFSLRELALLLMVPRSIRKPDVAISKHIYALGPVDPRKIPGVHWLPDPDAYYVHLIEHAYVVQDGCHAPYAAVITANTGVALTYPKEKINAWWGVLRGLLAGAAACIPTVGPILAAGINYVANAAITHDQEERAHASRDPLLPEQQMTYEQAHKVSTDAVKFLAALAGKIDKIKLFSSVHGAMLEEECSASEYNEAFRDSYNFPLLLAYEGKSKSELDAAITEATQAGRYFSP